MWEKRNILDGGCISPFHADGVSHTYLFDKYGIVNFVNEDVDCNTFPKMMHFCH